MLQSQLRWPVIGGAGEKQTAPKLHPNPWRFWFRNPDLNPKWPLKGFLVQSPRDRGSCLRVGVGKPSGPGYPHGSPGRSARGLAAYLWS